MKILIFSLFFLFATPTFAEDLCDFHPEACPTSLQDITGGTTVQTIIDQATLMTPTLTNTPGKTTGKTTGLAINYSSHIKVIALPLSYTLNKKSEINVSLPYVSKNLVGRYSISDTELTRSGLGDVTVGVTHNTKRKKIFITSNAAIKLPTGDQKSFADNTEQLPLGSGSFDLIFGSSATMKIEQVSGLYLTGSLFLRLNGAGKYTENATINFISDDYHFENSAGNSLTISLGGVYKLPRPKWLAYANIKYLHLGNSYEKLSSDIITNPAYERDLADSLSAIDITIGGHYQYQGDITMRAGITLPLMTGYDDSVTSGASREVTFDFGADYFW